MKSLLALALLACTLIVTAAVALRGEVDFYASRPLLERPVPLQEIPAGLTSLSAEECGSCHVDFYAEWQQSVHAQAWSDPQFQAEIHKDPAVSWMCINCHTPLVNQQDSLVVRLVNDDVSRPVRRANPDFDHELKQEAITCASCHVRDGAVEGPYGNTDAPHAVRYNPALRTTQTCERCHQAVQEYPGKSFVCTFRTGDEWRAGPFSADSGKTCQGCHMPAVQRPLVAGGEVRSARRHSWIGSRLRKGGEPSAALWDSLAAYIEPGVALEGGRAPRAGSGRAEWTVRVVNANAGHKLPTGDPERAVIITMAALDGAGDTLAVHAHRIAQIYEWYPEVKKLSDNRLAPGESRELTLSFSAPAAPYRLIAIATNERVSDATADYHDLPSTYVRRVEVARVELIVR